MTVNALIPIQEYERHEALGDAIYAQFSMTWDLVLGVTMDDVKSEDLSIEDRKFVTSTARPR